MTARAAVLAVRAYQRWGTRRTPRCPRTDPDGLSCSEYGVTVLRAHGFRRGIVLAAERLRACGQEGAAVGADPRNHTRGEP